MHCFYHDFSNTNLLNSVFQTEFHGKLISHQEIFCDKHKTIILYYENNIFIHQMREVTMQFGYLWTFVREQICIHYANDMKSIVHISAIKYIYQRPISVFITIL